MNGSRPSLSQSHPKLILGILIVVFFGPFVFAWISYHQTDPQSITTTNVGDLISPLVDWNGLTLEPLESEAPTFKASSLNGHWWLVYISPRHTNEDFFEALYNMRQIHVALGKNAPRAKRLVLFSPEGDPIPASTRTFLHENYPNLLAAKLNISGFQTIFAPHFEAEEQDFIGAYFLIDPKGRLVLHYSPDSSSKGILKDFSRLLKFSRTG